MSKVCEICGFQTYNGKTMSNHKRWKHVCNNQHDIKRFKQNLAKTTQLRLNNLLGQKKQFNVKCFKCNKQFIVTQREKQFPQKQKYFCSRFCSISYSSSFASDENIRNGVIKYNRNKKNISLQEYLTKFKCKICNKQISVKSRHRYCKQCYKNTQIYKQMIFKKCKKLSQIVNKRIAQGKHKGWITRDKISYPQQFFIKVLNNNNIKYDLNYSTKNLNIFSPKNQRYFLDFWMENKRLDLQIDGKQHNEEQQRKNDEIRNFILMKNDIIVYRIKWRNINNQYGKIYIKNQIDRFINFYNNLQ